MRELNEKQSRFVVEYLICPNATQAAISAGYSEKSARYTSRYLLKDPRIQEQLQMGLEKIADGKLATVQEVMEYLTSVMRGQTEVEVIVVEKTGGGCSRARRIMKGPSCAERIRAAELLGKRYGLFNDKMDISCTQRVIIVDDFDTVDAACSGSLPREKFIEQPNRLPAPQDK